MILFSFLLLLHLAFFKFKSKLLLMLSGIILFFIIAFRALSVGTDTSNYQNHFLYISHGTSIDIEFLWFYLNKIIAYYNGDFSNVLQLAALLTLVPIYIVIGKKSIYPLLSVFFYLAFYYYFYSFNIMRQGIAMSWGLLTIVSFIEGKKKWVVLFLPIAILFHYSAAIILPMLFIVYLFCKKKVEYTLPLQIGTMVLGLFLYELIIQSLTKHFYSNYSEIQGLNFFGNFISLLLLNALFILIKKITINRDYWYYFFLVFILLSNVLVRIPYGNRITMFLGILQIVFLPNLLGAKIPKVYKGLIYPLIIVYAIFLFSRKIGSGEIFPYINNFF